MELQTRFALLSKTDEPVLTGSAMLRTKIDIPEGDSDLIDRVKLNGQLGIEEAQFANPEIQGKIDTLSRKGQGHPKDMDINSVVSEMKGNFQVGT